MKLKIHALWLGTVFFLLSSAQARPLAYVYSGEGSCPEGCSEAAAQMAYQAGFKPIYIGPQAITEASSPEYIQHFFDGVKVWIQPGGHSKPAYEAMNPKLRDALVNFVFTGGGYVGFCAGAFITTKQIGTTGSPGFSIFPGATAPLIVPPARPELEFSIEEVQWNGKPRALYFEGGPRLVISKALSPLASPKILKNSSPLGPPFAYDWSGSPVWACRSIFMGAMHSLDQSLVHVAVYQALKLVPL